MAEILQPGDNAYYVNGQFVHIDLVTETIITETTTTTDVKYKLNRLGDVLISENIVGVNMSDLINKLASNIVYDIPAEL